MSAPVVPDVPWKIDGISQARFPFWRPHQQEAVERIIASDGLFMYEAPTGSGKSMVAVAAASLLERKLLYVVATRSLQDQIMGDFPHLFSLMGRSNYPCLLAQRTPTMLSRSGPPLGCDQCSHHPPEVVCPYYEDCLYPLAKNAAMRTRAVVMNVAYFLAEANHVGEFGDWADMLVIDEAHRLEAQLMKHVEVSISKAVMHDLGLGVPKHKTVVESWQKWVDHSIPIIGRDIAEKSSDLAAKAILGVDDHLLVLAIRSLQRLLGRLRFLAAHLGDEWVMYDRDRSYAWKPVWVHEWGQSQVFAHAKMNVICMSATILDPSAFTRDLGFAPKAAAFYSAPSVIPKENRRLVYIPVGDMVRKHQEHTLPKMVHALDILLAAHPDEKILVHAHSYFISQYLAQRVACVSRVVTHSSVDRGTAIADFRSSDRPLVMISPSMETGVSLDDDLSRVVVWAKMPFPDLSDPQVSRRYHIERARGVRASWYLLQTIRDFVQGCGRAARSPDKPTVTYVLDTAFERIYRAHTGIFPSWFRETVGI